MKLGILKTDTVRPEWVPTFGEYPDMFVRLLGNVDPDMEFVVYDVESGVYPNAIDEVDAYLITGSKASVYDEEAWIHALVDFLQQLHEQRKKVVGICFGHQLVAHALGGKVEKSHKGWGVGIHTHTLTAAPAWHDGLEPDFDILVSHQDQVVANPAGANVIGGSVFCENAVTQIGDHILTFQGHPEFVHDYSRELLISREDRVDSATYAAAMDSLSQPSQGDRVARWIVNFLRNS